MDIHMDIHGHPYEVLEVWTLDIMDIQSVRLPDDTNGGGGGQGAQAACAMKARAAAT